MLCGPAPLVPLVGGDRGEPDDVPDAGGAASVAPTPAPQAQHVLALERDVASTALDIAADVFGEESRRPGFRQDIEFVLSTVRGLALLRAASGGRLQAARGGPATRERLLALMS